jgi:hypothetical protein
MYWKYKFYSEYFIQLGVLRVLRVLRYSVLRALRYTSTSNRSEYSSRTPSLDYRRPVLDTGHVVQFFLSSDDVAVSIGSSQLSAVLSGVLIASLGRNFKKQIFGSS